MHVKYTHFCAGENIKILKYEMHIFACTQNIQAIISKNIKLSRVAKRYCTSIVVSGEPDEGVVQLKYYFIFLRLLIK